MNDYLKQKFKNKSITAISNKIYAYSFTFILKFKFANFFSVIKSGTFLRYFFFINKLISIT